MGAGSSRPVLPASPDGASYGCHLGATFGWRCLRLKFSRGSREQPKLRRNLPEPAAKARAGVLVIFCGFALLAHPNLTVLALPNPDGAKRLCGRFPLQPNYSLSIALQENALRVTWLAPGRSGSTAAGQRLTGSSGVHSPRLGPPLHGAMLRSDFVGAKWAREFSRGPREHPEVRRSLPDPAG